MRRLIAEGPSAAGVGARGDIPAAAAPSQELLHAGLTHPTEGGDGALRAERLSVGLQDLRSEVKRVGVQAHQPHP